MSFKEGKLDVLIGSSEYHSAIVSTYTLDPQYLSTIFSSLVRSKQIKNLIVLCDIGEYHRICSNPDSFELLQNSKVIVLPAQTNRLFHPKIIFLVGKKAVSSIIGSGNLTYSGMGGNDEIWGGFHVVDGQWENAQVVKKSWEIISQHLPDLIGLGKQLTSDWILNYSECFKKILQDTSLPNSNTDHELLINEPGDSIWDKIIHRLSGEKISTVNVISPYFDSKASLLKRIKDELTPATINVIYDEHGLLPDRLDYLDGINFYSWQLLKSKTSTLHAKILSFNTISGRMFNVIGSANATPSGLGIKRELNNVEAVVMFESTDNNFNDIFGYDLSKFEAITFRNLPENENTVSEPESQLNAWGKTFIIYSEINGQKLSICFNKKIGTPLTIEIGVNQDEIVLEHLSNLGVRVLEIDLSSKHTEKPFKVRKIKVEGQPYWTVVHTAKVLRSNSPDPKFEQFDRALDSIETNDYSYLVNALTQSLTEENVQVKQKFSTGSTKSNTESPDANLNLSKEDFIEKKNKADELHELQSEFYLTSVQKLIEKYSSNKSVNTLDNTNKETLNQNSEEEIPVEDELTERPESMVTISKKSDVLQQRRAYRKFFNRTMRYYENIDSITSLEEFKEEIVQKRVVSYWLLVLHVALSRIKEELIEKIENDERVGFTISPKNRGASISLEKMNSHMIPRVVGHLRIKNISFDEILDEDQNLDCVSTIVVLLSLQYYGLNQKNILRKRICSVLDLFNVVEEDYKLLKSKITKIQQSLFPNDTSLQNDWRYQRNLDDNLKQVKSVIG